MTATITKSLQDLRDDLLKEHKYANLEKRSRQQEEIYMAYVDGVLDMASVVREMNV